MQLVWVPCWWRREHVAHMPNGLCLHLSLLGDVDPVHVNGAIIRRVRHLAPEGAIDHAGRLATKDEVYGTLWFASACLLGGLFDFVRCAEAAQRDPVVLHDSLKAPLNVGESFEPVTPLGARLAVAVGQRCPWVCGLLQRVGPGILGMEK